MQVTAFTTAVLWLLLLLIATTIVLKISIFNAALLDCVSNCWWRCKIVRSTTSHGFRKPNKLSWFSF